MQPPRTAGQPFEERRRRWCALIRRGGSCVPRCLELQLIIASGIFRLSRSRTNSYGTRYEADAGVVIARWDIERTTDADRLQEYSEKKRVFFFFYCNNSPKDRRKQAWLRGFNGSKKKMVYVSIHIAPRSLPFSLEPKYTSHSPKSMRTGTLRRCVR